MPLVRAGEVRLGWREWGRGDTTVVFIHELSPARTGSNSPHHFRRYPGDRMTAASDSDRPAPTPDYANYSMQQHADDMMAALDELKISFAIRHPGNIAARMLLRHPNGSVGVRVDPVTPLGMAFNAEQIGLFRAMMLSKDLTRTVMATAASSLFVPESLLPDMAPIFREGLGKLQAFFERIIEQSFGVSEGIWIGTPTNLTLERASGELERRMAEIKHEHLVLWGEKDGWIAPADLKTMANAMPNCRLVTVPGIGHSMNLEGPEPMPAISGMVWGLRQ